MLQKKTMRLVMCSFVIGLIGTPNCLSSFIQTARVTLYTVPITWNKAYKFCHAMNQTLLTIDSQDRLDALHYFLTKKPWSYVKDLQFWTGLHLPNKEENDRFKWESSCQEPVVALWGASPPNTSNHRYCVFSTLRNSQVTLETSDCYQSEKMFMCEERNDGCLYDVIHRAFGNILTKKHIQNASVSLCKNSCNDFVSNSGHRCSGFNYNDNFHSCGLMTSDNLYRLDKYHRPSPIHRLFVKRCVIQAILDITKTKPQRVCLLAPASRCAASQDVCKRPHGKQQSDPGECVCQYQKATPILNLTERIEQIVETIRISPKNTSFAIRQKISINDSRVSSRGIGFVATAIISIIFGGILFMDLNTLRRHLAGYVKKRRQSLKT